MVYKWRVRYMQGGQATLHNLSSWSRRSHRRLPVERVAAIAAMRRMGLSPPPMRPLLHGSRHYKSL